MKQSFLKSVMARRSTIKQRWLGYLRQAPARTPLANPELLAYMMNETLTELFAMKSATSAPNLEIDRTTTTVLARTACRCGLNPYIGYFLAGEAALVSVIREMKPSSCLTENDILRCETELLFSLRVLGHQEVDAFCIICRIEHPSSDSPCNSASLPSDCPFKESAPDFHDTRLNTATRP